MSRLAALLATAIRLGAVLLLVGAPAARADDQGALADLLARSRTAMGGDAVDRRLVLETRATITVGGITGTQTAWREIGGRRYAQRSVAPPFEIADGFDGRSVWNADGTGLVWTEDGALGASQEIMLAYLLNDRLWTRDHGGAGLAWAGERMLGAKRFDAIRVAAPGAIAPFELWLDRQTGLPARAIQTFGPVSATVELSDYRSVGGLKAPAALHMVDQDGNETDIRVTSFVRGHDHAAELRRPRTAPHDFAIAGGAPAAIVSLELVDNHVVIPVKLNGKGPYRFILDTGSENVVDPAVALEIQASARGNFQGEGSGEAAVSLSATTVGLVQIGGARMTRQVFSVAPVRTGFGMASGQPVDGLVGFELLSRFVTTIDYGRRRVILRTTSAPQPSGVAIPLVLDGRTPRFTCAINDLPGQCTLDTGSRDSVAVYAPFVAAHPEIQPAAHTAVGVDGFGFGGAALGRLGRLQSFRLGPFELPQLAANFSTDEGGVMARPCLAGNVGGGVWRRFAVTLDYRRHEVVLRPNRFFGAPDDRERAGLFLINRGGDIRVLDVRPGTPAAEAGIKADDVIETLDGATTAAMSLQAVRKAFLAPSGTRVSLGVRAKDGSRRGVVITLRTII